MVKTEECIFESYYLVCAELNPFSLSETRSIYIATIFNLKKPGIKESIRRPSVCLVHGVKRELGFIWMFPLFTLGNLHSR